jgi:hypothetical protein
VDRLEHGDAVGAAIPSPSRVNELAQFGGDGGDPGIAISPVIAAAGEEPRRLAVPADDQPERWRAWKTSQIQPDRAVGHDAYLRLHSGCVPSRPVLKQVLPWPSVNLAASSIFLRGGSP